MHRPRLTTTDLPPDAFAVVMATGIVSFAANQLHYPRISAALAVLAGLAFVLLGAGLVVRVVARPGSAVAELGDPDVAFRLFTAVAACTVLGARFAGTEPALWFLGTSAVVGWLVLAPLAIADVRRRPRDELRDHAHGAWLLPAVATAGLAITAADLGVHTRSGGLLAAGLIAWLLGLAVYGAVVWLIAWRALAAPFRPDLVTPDSWILMGALAISALAGDRLLQTAHAVHSASWLPHAIHGLTLTMWILASLSVPALLYAEMWSVDHRPGSLHYTRVWWSAVFPLGMYSAASAATAEQLGIRSLRTISLVMFWNALTVWLLVAIGWLHTTIAARRAARA